MTPTRASSATALGVPLGFASRIRRGAPLVSRLPLFRGLRREIKELYLTIAITRFGASLIAVFEPVFLYNFGVPLWGVALYFGAASFLYMGLMPLGARFAARWGFEHMILISRPLFVVYFLSLVGMERFPGVLFLGPLLRAAAEAAFWPAYHADFAHYGSAHRRGEEISGLGFLSTAASSIGPIAGGLIIREFGFPVLFAVGSLMVVLSAIPLFTTRERFRPTDFSYAWPWRMLGERKYRRDVVSYLGFGETAAHLLFWPLFLFLTVGGFVEIGAIASVGVFTSALAGIGIGRSADHATYRAVLRHAAPIYALTFLLRPFARPLLPAFAIDMVTRVGEKSVGVPLFSIIYNRGRQLGHHLRYITLAELAIHLGKGTYCLLLVPVFAVFDPPLAFTLAFILAAAYSLLYLLTPDGNTSARRSRTALVAHHHTVS